MKSDDSVLNAMDIADAFLVVPQKDFTIVSCKLVCDCATCLTVQGEKNIGHVNLLQVF